MNDTHVPGTPPGQRMSPARRKVISEYDDGRAACRGHGCCGRRAGDIPIATDITQ